MRKQRALFLDRDGVINHRIIGGYVTSPSEFVLDANILPLLAMAHNAGYILVVITNQQGVGKGLMTLDDLHAVHQQMNSLIHRHLGFQINHIYACTSLASENDPRRKPSPGMLLDAIEDLDIDPAASWFVGDSITDAQAGRAAGVHTVLIGQHPQNAADIVVADIGSVPASLMGNLHGRDDV